MAASLRLLLDLLQTLQPQHTATSVIATRLLLTIDEAQELCENSAGQSWTGYTEFRRVLRRMNALPMFTLFVSTRSDIIELPPAPIHLHSASRVQPGSLVPIAPFVETNYDVFYDPVSEGELTLDEATSNARVVNLGRPLFGARYGYGGAAIQRDIVNFAMQKLTGVTNLSDWDISHSPIMQLAVLATRIPLAMDPTDCGATRQLVQQHMQLCLTTRPNGYTLRTESSSEPLLAEAATRVMHRFDPLYALAAALDLSTIRLSGRGEVVAALILLQAMDATNGRARVVSVVSFIEKLVARHSASQNLLAFAPSFSHDSNDHKPFCEQFQYSKMWFNHFIKVADGDVLNREYLWRFMLRGAAILCATGQAGWDLVLPFAFRDEKLGRDSVSAIIVRVKNDRHMSKSPRTALLDIMDPVDLGIFDEGNSLPVIRIVMALGGGDSVIYTRNPYKRQNDPRLADSEFTALPSRSAAAPFNDRTSNFTSYDMWMAGVRPTRLKPELAHTYERILRASRQFHGEEEDPLAGYRLGLRAGQGTASGHWAILKEADETGEDQRVDA